MIEEHFAFIRPVVEYGDVEWGNCTKDNSELLERVQIEAARINTGLRVNSSKSNLYKELVWEPWQARWDKHKLTLFYESINGIAPQYISDLIKPFLPTEQIHNLRLSGNLFCLSNNFLLQQYYSINNQTLEWARSWYKNSPTLSILKSKKTESSKNPKSTLNFGNRRENIILCQLQNKASNLNARLFKDYIWLMIHTVYSVAMNSK